MMFFDPEFVPTKLVVRYVIGQQEREALVLANGHSLKEHVDRLEAIMETNNHFDEDTTPADSFVTWPLAAGGAVAIRVNSIIALEALGT
ncbi:hypothetical protein ACFU99_00835 [Streptomyces sp. NPDC057654]|uniref:hypothetical protein n=1 Tax=Streptomyces sp. NPDC057654 TaxID=3346196 RepID=UPI00368DD84C